MNSGKPDSCKTHGCKFESKLSNLIGGSYTNSSKLDSCMTHGCKN